MSSNRNRKNGDKEWFDYVPLNNSIMSSHNVKNLHIESKSLLKISTSDNKIFAKEREITLWDLIESKLSLL